MDIGFVRDEIKYQAVVNKHNVHFYEVVAALDDPDGYELSDPAELKIAGFGLGERHGIVYCP